MSISFYISKFKQIDLIMPVCKSGVTGTLYTLEHKLTLSRKMKMSTPWSPHIQLLRL